MGQGVFFSIRLSHYSERFLTLFFLNNDFRYLTQTNLKQI